MRRGEYIKRISGETAITITGNGAKKPAGVREEKKHSLAG